MSTISTIEPSRTIEAGWVPPAGTLYRLSVDQYESMIAAGMFRGGARLELIEGLLVAKMSKKYPPHSTASELCRLAIERLLPAGWHGRVEKPVRIVGRASELEPDFSVARGGVRDYSGRNPEPADVVLVVEVADSSLSDDRKIMARIYGDGGIPVYWIINLVDRQVELHAEPISGGYGSRAVFGADAEIPVVVDSREVGRIAVAELLP